MFAHSYIEESNWHWHCNTC